MGIWKWLVKKDQERRIRESRHPSKPLLSMYPFTELQRKILLNNECMRRMMFARATAQNDHGDYYQVLKYKRTIETLTVDYFGNIKTVVHKLDGSFVSENTIPPKIPKTLQFEGISDDDMKLI
jgi:hypothetical protein